MQQGEDLKIGQHIESSAASTLAGHIGNGLILTQCEAQFKKRDFYRASNRKE
jgi:hypothetical protein